MEISTGICQTARSRFFTHSNHFIFSFGAEDAHNYIDLPPGLLSSSNTASVTVTALVSVCSAKDLLVEPVTTEDWELSQIDAAWLENGGLLQQISVVYVNQIIPLLLSNGSDVARIRVMPPSPQKSGWPTDENTTDPMCFHLVDDTCVSVAPKPRKEQTVPKLRLYPTRGDYGDAEIQLASHLNVNLVSIDQCTVAIHPNTLLAYNARTMIGTVRSNEEFSIVRIVSCLNVPEHHIGTYVIITAD